MRYERKYQINHLNKWQVIQIVQLHPAGFRKIYPDRQVNNIYFDSPDFQTWRHNIDGVNQRKKYRLRWYGKEIKALNNPQFEIKIKQNELGAKEVYNFKSYSLQDLEKITSQINQVHTSHYPGSYLQLSPTLLNTYQRSYFGTSNKKFRITVDYNLRFYAPLHKAAFCPTPYIQASIILELKYDEKMDQAAKEIFKFLPFRQTKNSKYVTGVLMGIQK